MSEAYINKYMQLIIVKHTNVEKQFSEMYAFQKTQLDQLILGHNKNEP